MIMMMILPNIQTVWSHESVKDTVKFDKRVKLRVPKKVFLLEREGQKQLLRHPQVMISHRKSKEVINIAWFGMQNLTHMKA